MRLPTVAFVACIIPTVTTACEITLRRPVATCPAVAYEPDDCTEPKAGKAGDFITPEGTLHVMEGGYRFYCPSHESCVQQKDLSFKDCRFDQLPHNKDVSPQYLEDFFVHDADDRPSGDVVASTLEPPSSASATSHVGESKPMMRMTSRGLEPVPSNEKANGSLGGLLNNGGLSDVSEELRGNNFDSLPRIDVAQNCRQIARSAEQQGSMADIVEACMVSEQDSYDQLKAVWSSSPIDSRKQCLQVVSITSIAGAVGGRQKANQGAYSVLLSCMKEAQAGVEDESRTRDVERKHRFRY